MRAGLRPPAPSGKCGRAANPSPCPARDRLGTGRDTARSEHTWSTGPTSASHRERSSRRAFPQLELPCSEQKPPAIQNVPRIERQLYGAHAPQAGRLRPPRRNLVARFGWAMEDGHADIARQTVAQFGDGVNEIR